MKEKIFYTTGEIARMLGVSPTTMFRAIENKQLAAATTPGGHYRVSREDLEAFLKKNNVPVKVLEPDRAVNLTLGLPYIRTSPDHGTAFDRAGLWTADATNFLEAAALAVRLAGRAKGQAWRAEAACAGTPG